MRYFWLWRWLGFESVAVAAHWAVRRSYFQVEDFLWLHLSSWQSVLASFAGPWGYATAYRPVIRLSYWLNDLAFGEWAPGWHFTNVAVHGANAALLAVLLERLGLRRAPATAAGLLFVVAPLTAECVDLISDRTVIICFLAMLLATLVWLAALRRPDRASIAALIGCALLGAMSYEAGFILPAVLLCLMPFALRQTGAPLLRAVRLVGSVVLALTLMFGLRELFIGMLTSDIDGRHPDPVTALMVNGPGIAEIFYINFGRFELSCLAAALALALVFRQTRLAALAALALMAVFYLPYLMVTGLSDRFFYMVMAPFCVLAVLAANQPARTVRLVAALLALGLFFPGFLAQTRADARDHADAGQHVALLRRNIITTYRTTIYRASSTVSRLPRPGGRCSAISSNWRSRMR
jgi:hypothetical protein